MKGGVGRRGKNFAVIEALEPSKEEREKIAYKREDFQGEPIEIQSSELEPIEPKPLEIEPHELGPIEAEEPVIKRESTRGKKLEPLEIPRDELEPLEREHQENLRRINGELTELLKVQRGQKEEFWSFLPGKKRIIAKLEQEIAGLKTRARIERMQIAEITQDYHSDMKKDLKNKLRREALKPFFKAIQETKKSAKLNRSEEDEGGDVSAEVVDNTFFIQGLYKEKARLQAEREGWALAFRPFRRQKIDVRLEEVTREIESLQRQVREKRRGTA